MGDGMLTLSDYRTISLVTAWILAMALGSYRRSTARLTHDRMKVRPSSETTFGNPARLATAFNAEAQAFAAVQLAQHSLLFLQVGIDGSVLFVHPAREHHHEHLQRRVQYPSTRRFQNA